MRTDTRIRYGDYTLEPVEATEDFMRNMIHVIDRERGAQARVPMRMLETGASSHDFVKAQLDASAMATLYRKRFGATI